MKIFAIAWKDALIRFSDRSELLFFLILPLVFTYILSGGAPQGSNEYKITLLVTDQDQTALSAVLAEAVEASGSITISPRSFSDAETALAGNNAPAWLIIPDGFEATLIAGESLELDLRKQPNSSDADGAARAVSAAASRVSSPIAAALTSVAEAEALRPFADEAERQAYFSSALAEAQQALADTPERVTTTRAVEAADDEYDAASQASAGQMITWVFIPLLGASGLFAFERHLKTLQRLLTTPTSKSTFLLGSIVGWLTTGIVQMVLLIGFGALVMKVNWGRSIPAVAVLLVCFGLASVAFGVMMGTFVKTEKQASNLSIMMGMVMALLGGCWWPLELFPPAVKTAVHVLPTTWAMEGFTDLLMRGQGFEAILLPSAVLVGFAVVFFALGLARFRYE